MLVNAHSRTWNAGMLQTIANRVTCGWPVPAACQRSCSVVSTRKVGQATADFRMLACWIGAEERDRTVRIGHQNQPDRTPVVLPETPETTSFLYCWVSVRAG
jgi:hypothetical protein